MTTSLDPALLARLREEGDRPLPLFDPDDPADPAMELALIPREEIEPA